MIKLKDSDWTHLRETFNAAKDGCKCDGCKGKGECDECNGLGWWAYEGEIVMTSIGYVDLECDGNVVAFGRFLGNVA